SRQREYTHESSNTGILDLSDKVFILNLWQLDPTSLLRVGSTCRTLFQICSCNSLWTRHRCHLESRLPPPTAPSQPRLHCNRSLQEKLFAEIPFPSRKHWTQWLVLEEMFHLPSMRLPCSDIESLLGIEDVLEDKDDDEGNILKFEWKELYYLALEHASTCAKGFYPEAGLPPPPPALPDHRELDTMFSHYPQCRFQWLFTYWLFRQPSSFDRQLRAIYLQWRKHSKRKMASWGGTLCDVRYLATGFHAKCLFSFHPGIQTVENYFSMCNPLVALIVKDTLEGVYLLLREMQETLVEHKRFWQVAKTAINWKIIETLLYIVSGNAVYRGHVQGFLQRKRFTRVLPDNLYPLLEFDTKISQGKVEPQFSSMYPETSIIIIYSPYQLQKTLFSNMTLLSATETSVLQ
uniref:Si:dkeyp-114g9.1 n=1 Tax=Salmo trutta TaxID=8032 RepID=A0A673Y3Z0_SALTR